MAVEALSLREQRPRSFPKQVSIQAVPRRAAHGTGQEGYSLLTPRNLPVPDTQLIAQRGEVLAVTLRDVLGHKILEEYVDTPLHALQIRRSLTHALLQDIARDECLVDLLRHLLLDIFLTERIGQASGLIGILGRHGHLN